MGWDYKATGTNSNDVLQQIRDQIRVDTPGVAPPELSDLVAKAVETLGTTSGEAPVGKQFNATTTGDLNSDVTVTVKLEDQPAPTGTEAPATDTAESGATSTSGSHRGKRWGG